MALINCPECGSSISDKAPTCIKCGVPLSAENVATQSNLSTIQETSKPLKLQALVSVIAITIGTLFAIYSDTAKAIGVVIAALGLLGYIVTRFRTWWHHK